MGFSSAPMNFVERYANVIALVTVVLTGAAIFSIQGAPGRAIQQWKNSSGTVVCTLGSGGTLSGNCLSNLSLTGSSVINGSLRVIGSTGSSTMGFSAPGNGGGVFIVTGAGGSDSESSYDGGSGGPFTIVLGAAGSGNSQGQPGAFTIQNYAGGAIMRADEQSIQFSQNTSMTLAQINNLGAGGVGPGGTVGIAVQTPGFSSNGAQAITVTGRAGQNTNIFTMSARPGAVTKDFFWSDGTGSLTLRSVVASRVPLTISGMTLQTGNLTNWIGVGTAIVASVDKTGSGSFSNLGVGTRFPKAKLDVTGTISGSSLNLSGIPAAGLGKAICKKTAAGLIGYCSDSSCTSCL